MTDLGKKELEAVLEFSIVIQMEDERRRYILPTKIAPMLENNIYGITGVKSVESGLNWVAIECVRERTWVEIDREVIDAIAKCYTLHHCSLVTSPIPKIIGPC